MSDEQKQQESSDLPAPSLSPSPSPATVPERPSAPEQEAAKLDLKVKEDSDEAEPQVELAPLNARLLGGLIDVLVASGLYIAVSSLMPEFLERIFWLVPAAYWVTRDSLSFMKGQSIGKMAMKTRVDKLDGSPMVDDWRTAVIRNGAMLVPLFPFVEAMILINRDNGASRGTRLGDEWARTRVVNVAQEEEPEEE